MVGEHFSSHRRDESQRLHAAWRCQPPPYRGEHQNDSRPFPCQAYRCKSARPLARPCPGGSGVVAQTAPASTDQGAKTLDVITVTAEKREEDIQKVPISISTIPAEELDVLRLGGDDIRSLSARVPSLLIESSFGRTFPRFYIRGLGNTDFDLNASQPVSLVYDDVVLENPILKGFPIFDLDQVEVFRGPQGTLFGRNTPAGVVKLDSRKPTTDT
jgi:iron complex outermembrane receptor protein